MCGFARDAPHSVAVFTRILIRLKCSREQCVSSLYATHEAACIFTVPVTYQFLKITWDIQILE